MYAGCTATDGKLIPIAYYFEREGGKRREVTFQVCYANFHSLCFNDSDHHAMQTNSIRTLKKGS
jgi:hypothetical protein